MTDTGERLRRRDGVIISMTDPTLPSTLLRGQDMPVGIVMFSPGTAPRNLLTMGTIAGDEPNARLWNVPDSLLDPVVLRSPKPSLLLGWR